MTTLLETTRPLVSQACPSLDERDANLILAFLMFIGLTGPVAQPNRFDTFAAGNLENLTSLALGQEYENPSALVGLLSTFVSRNQSESFTHMQRVACLSGALARRLALTEAEISDVENGAMLHDIGKMGIPLCLLNLPRPLSVEERSVVEQHTVLGERFLRRFPCLSGVCAEAAAAHHEHWDGSGYPHGLVGPEIPLSGRIVALADVYDALTSDRPYRRAWTADQAIAYIESEAGHGFDPCLTRTFLEMPTKDSN